MELHGHDYTNQSYVWTYHNNKCKIIKYPYDRTISCYRVLRTHHTHTGHTYGQPHQNSYRRCQLFVAYANNWVSIRWLYLGHAYCHSWFTQSQQSNPIPKPYVYSWLLGNICLHRYKTKWMFKFKSNKSVMLLMLIYVVPVYLAEQMNDITIMQRDNVRVNTFHEVARLRLDRLNRCR